MHYVLKNDSKYRHLFLNNQILRQIFNVTNNFALFPIVYLSSTNSYQIATTD